MSHLLENAPPASVDPNRGFLCLWTYWRPNPDAPNPDLPGIKQQSLTYLTFHPNTHCLCGSRLPYHRCCQSRPYWQAICFTPDAEQEQYRLVAPQTAIFESVPGALLRQRLNGDNRFKPVEDTPARAFWIYWGDPAFEGQFGTLCFGDVELQDDQRLIVTAMSAQRMALLLYVLYDCSGSLLTIPRIAYDPLQVIDKQTGERVSIDQTPTANSPRWSQTKRRK
jgi:hypothetical protein